MLLDWWGLGRRMRGAWVQGEELRLRGREPLRKEIFIQRR